MTRNEIIQEVDRLRHKVFSITVPFGWDSLEREKWTLVGECERFANDLCNAATLRNRRLGAVVYTVRTGQEKLGELARKIRPWVFEQLLRRAA